MVSPRSHAHPRSGFTLVELLCVVAIMGIVAAMTITSIRHTSWNNVKDGATSLGNTVDYARQYAILNRCISALVVATEGEDAYRAFAVMKKSDSNWTQISRWHKLPDGAIFDFVAQSNFFATDMQGYTNMSMPTLTQSGTSLEPGTGYKAQLFYSNGQIEGNNPSTLRVIQGHLDASASLVNQATNRYMDVVMIPVSGKVKYSSP